MLLKYNPFVVDRSLEVMGFSYGCVQDAVTEAKVSPCGTRCVKFYYDPRNGFIIEGGRSKDIRLLDYACGAFLFTPMKRQNENFLHLGLSFDCSLNHGPFAKNNLVVTLKKWIDQD